MYIVSEDNKTFGFVRNELIPMIALQAGTPDAMNAASQALAKALPIGMMKKVQSGEVNWETAERMTLEVFPEKMIDTLAEKTKIPREVVKMMIRLAASKEN